MLHNSHSELFHDGPLIFVALVLLFFVSRFLIERHLEKRNKRKSYAKSLPNRLKRHPKKHRNPNSKNEA